MKIDITYPLKQKTLENLLANALANQRFNQTWHFGTHFDIMNQEFSLDNCERKGRLFDVSFVKDRDIEVEDLDISKIIQHDFVIFFTDFLKEDNYGTNDYFNNHPQLSNGLIECLVAKQVSLIGIDAPGIRRTSSAHAQVDQFCSDHGIFNIENLYHLKELLDQVNEKEFLVHTYPMVIIGSTGLPCRVIAELKAKAI